MHEDENISLSLRTLRKNRRSFFKGDKVIKKKYLILSQKKDHLFKKLVSNIEIEMKKKTYAHLYFFIFIGSD